MAGWDVTVLCAALSVLGGIVWAAAKLALDGSQSALARRDLAAKRVEARSDFGVVSLQGND